MKDVILLLKFLFSLPKAVTQTHTLPYSSCPHSDDMN
uniref:Uncharacterized protein n=1 Tax=Anguilla anguilla TaxID=7936 RepID=A0A0E9SVE2_ANGAN